MRDKSASEINNWNNDGTNYGLLITLLNSYQHVMTLKVFIIYKPMSKDIDRS